MPTSPRAPERPPAVDRPALGVLAFGVACVSSAAVLIRLSAAPPLAIAAWRLVFASLILCPAALLFDRRSLAGLTAGDVRRMALSGAFLAAHFGLWIASLGLTSVASSVSLVTTNPLWVGLAAPLVLREAVPRRLLAGIGLACGGAVVIGWGDGRSGGTALGGDALALGGAWAAAAYFMIGRDVRRRVGLLPYVAVVYAVAAGVLVCAAAVTRTPLSGFAPATWTALVLLGVVPQVLGHSSFNWALRRLSATFVAGSVLGEAVGSTLLAWWVLAEAPPPHAVLGGAMVLAGLVVAARAERRRRALPAPAA